MGRGNIRFRNREVARDCTVYDEGVVHRHLYIQHPDEDDGDCERFRGRFLCVQQILTEQFGNDASRIIHPDMPWAYVPKENNPSLVMVYENSYLGVCMTEYEGYDAIFIFGQKGALHPTDQLDTAVHEAAIRIFYKIALCFGEQMTRVRAGSWTTITYNGVPIST